MTEADVCAYNHQDNLTGYIFGKFTVIGFAGKLRKRQEVWICRCECGNYETRTRDYIHDHAYDCCHPCNHKQAEEKKCKNKKKFPDMVAAQQKLTRYYMNHGMHKGMSAYRCSICGCYHIGHNGKIVYLKNQNIEKEVEFRQSTLDWTY